MNRTRKRVHLKKEKGQNQDPEIWALTKHCGLFTFAVTWKAYSRSIKIHRTGSQERDFSVREDPGCFLLCGNEVFFHQMALDQVSANYSPQAKSCPSLVFVNKVWLEHSQTYYLIFGLWLFSLYNSRYESLQQRPHGPQNHLSGPLQEKFHDPYSSLLARFSRYQHGIHDQSYVQD